MSIELPFSVEVNPWENHHLQAMKKRVTEAREKLKSIRAFAPALVIIGSTFRD
jgi:hypothetical protein